MRREFDPNAPYGGRGGGSLAFSTSGYTSTMDTELTRENVFEMRAFENTALVARFNSVDPTGVYAQP